MKTLKEIKNYKELLNYAYELYKQDWCETRGYNLKEVEKHEEEGYDNEMYVCLKEFENNEFQEESYMKHLIENNKQSYTDFTKLKDLLHFFIVMYVYAREESVLEIKTSHKEAIEVLKKDFLNVCKENNYLIEELGEEKGNLNENNGTAYLNNIGSCHECCDWYILEIKR